MINPGFHQKNKEFFLKYQSNDCDINFEIEVSNEETLYHQKKMMMYGFFMTCIGLTHMYAIVKVIKSLIENESEGDKYSLIMLTIIALWDANLCLSHFIKALESEVSFHSLRTYSSMLSFPQSPTSYFSPYLKLES